MLISYEWLKDYTDCDYDIETLESKVSLQGLEVEAIEKYGGVIDNLVIGQIKNIKKHPNADKLSVCDVDIGNGETRQIVCGAPNVWDKKNPKVIVALNGCFLPKLGVKIKKTKLRGEVSNGMIVSEEELGLADKSEGIWLLPDNAKIGEYPTKYIPKEDYIIEIAPTANRGDVLGIIGFAREIAAMGRTKVRYPQPQIKVNKDIEKPNINIEDSDLCFRFTSRIIKGVKVGQSPQWLKDRLKKVGQRPINNIVDISNYIMFETGHPNHIYDLNKLKNKQIVVRRAKDGETIKTLDDVDRRLHKDILVIADSENPVGLAGVMGSESSEVSEETTDLLLEAAYFLPHNIRRTSKELGLSTDASYRFERNADINVTKLTIDRLTELVTEICGGEVSEMTDEYPNKVEPISLDFSLSYLERLAGHPIPKKDTLEILESLEFGVVEKNKDTYSLIVPTFKTDVTRPIDVVEEVTRVYGYNKIPDKVFPMKLNENLINTKIHLKDRIRQILTGFGLNEVMTYSFVLTKDIETLKLDTDKVIRISNPLSKEFEILRPSLIPNLINTAIFNLSRGNKSVSVFEVGHIYKHSDKSDPKYDESKNVGLILTGEIEEKCLYTASRQPDFYDLKGIVNELINRLGLDAKYKPTTETMLHPGKGADVIINNNKIGFIGELHPEMKKKYKIAYPVIIGELSIDSIGAMKVPEKSYTDISKFPAVFRDANFEVKSDVTNGDISQAIEKAGGKILHSYRLVDIYIDDKLSADDKKSMTYEFIFQDINKTLDEKGIDEVMSRIVNKVKKATGGTLRGV